VETVKQLIQQRRWFQVSKHVEDMQFSTRTISF